MCNFHDDNKDLLPKAKNSLSVGKKCMKCEKTAVTTARTKDPFCKECFNTYFVHRFRATFGKVRLFTAGEKVLLAFSGGMSSRVLLGLAEEGLKLTVYKKLRFEPTVVIIDEGVVLGVAWNERCRQLSQCLAIATATGFHTIYTSIEQVFGECAVYDAEQLLKDPGDTLEGASNVAKKEHCSKTVSNIVDSQNTDDEHGETARHARVDDTVQRTDIDAEKRISREMESRSEGGELRDDDTLQDEVLYQTLLRGKREEGLEQQVGALFASCSSVTSQENLLVSLRRQLLVEVARKQGYAKVLMGDNATRLAVRLLGNVAQGRGRTLPLDTGFIDDRTTDVSIVRPLREFPANEVAMYATFNGLHSLSIPHLTTLEPEQASIERLTESFVAGLQVDFPSTVSTVFRTGDKLAVRSDDKLKRQFCSLCKAPSGPPVDPSVFTHLSLANGDSDLWSQLCYGCQLTVKDLNYRLSPLPPFVHHSSKVDSCSKTPSSIKDFLLDET